MALYVYAGKIVRRGSGFLSTGGGASGATTDSPSQLEATGGSGTFTVIWNAPIMNADGSTPPSIGSYLIYWGTTQGEQHNGGSFTGSSSVAAGTLTKTVNSLGAGTWWIAASTVNVAGVEGAGSGEIQVTVT